MIIEAYFGLALISVILFTATLLQKNNSPLLPMIALSFMIMTSIASFDIEKSYLTSEQTICNTVSEYTTTNTSHCVDFTKTNTYTTQTYQNSFPLGIIFGFFSAITLLLLIISIMEYLNNSAKVV